MTVTDVVKALELTVYSGKDGLNKNVSGGYTSDLLSDVMGNACEDMAWITLQTHKNVMAIASLKDLSAVILVNNLQPDEDTRVHSDQEQVPILGTSLSAFDISGRLYNLLNRV